MSSQTLSMTGGCLCGAVRYETGAEPLWLCHCHCSMCRRQTGAALATYVIYPAGTVEWLQRRPTRYRTSQDVERSFCSTCGSTIGFHRAHETSIHLGSLDRPEDVVIDEGLRLHVMYEDHVSWFDTADSWPRHERFPPDEEEKLRQMSGQPIKG